MIQEKNPIIPKLCTSQNFSVKILDYLILSVVAFINHITDGQTSATFVNENKNV